MRTAPKLIRQQFDTRSASYLTELEAVHQAHGQLLDADQALHNRVREAKAAGASWQQIADSLYGNTTRQAAQQRFGSSE